MGTLRFYHDNNRPELTNGWETCERYNSSQISKIKDPNGTPASKDITSIPSPWARLELIDTAFGEVVASGQLEGTSIYHRMVSDCLDVAEIFFNIDRLRDLFEIVVWHRSEIEQLRRSAAHLFGESLDLFLNTDAAAFNFDRLSGIYLLKYNGPDKGAPLRIVGGTSPKTLFFTPGGDQGFVSPHVCFGNDRPFDGTYVPLHRRDDRNFIRFWFALREMWNTQGQGNFDLDFPAVSKYLNMVYTHLDNSLVADIDRGGSAFWNALPTLDVGGEAASLVEILGFPLRKTAPLDVRTASDFVVAGTRPDLNPNDQLPLVLPDKPGTLYSTLTYTTAPWDGTIMPPRHEAKAPNLRTLPGDGTLYPYLSIDDFLEDTLIVNQRPATAAFPLSRMAETDSHILLPIKAAYFEYFTPDDLERHLHVEHTRIGTLSRYTVTLDIPIRGRGTVRTVRFTRDYALTGDNDRYGDVLLTEFIVGLTPFAQLPEGAADYRVFVCPIEPTDAPVTATFHTADGREVVPSAQLAPNTRDAARHRLTDEMFQPRYYRLDHPFDYLNVACGEVHGVLLPKFPATQDAPAFHFAIDFGTTNTHIEGATHRNACLPQDQLLAATRIVFAQQNLPTELPDFERILLNDLYPQPTADGHFRHPFPRRTVLAHRRTIDWSPATVRHPLLDGQLPFVHGERNNLAYNRLCTNLKWDRTAENEAQMRLYVSNLLYLLRNKVAEAGGNLADTRITWFYPSSMPTNRINLLRRVWGELYTQYFGGAPHQVTAIAEALAPFSYFVKEHAASQGLCTIDIGGGTTDVVYAREGRPERFTSMRFATGSLWGEGGNTSLRQNGFVRAFDALISEQLATEGDLAALNLSVRESGSSVDLLNFWMTLAESTAHRVDFTAILDRNEAFKPVFLTFYASLIFHVARWVKLSGLDVPRHIGFSGNGSRIVNALADVRYSRDALNALTRAIFDHVWDEPEAAARLEVIFEDHPKEITCRGPLLNPELYERGIDFNALKSAVWGGRDLTDIPAGTRRADLTPTVRRAVEAEVSDFVHMLRTIDDRLNFRDLFGLPLRMTDYLDVLLRDVAKYIDDGIRLRYGTANDPDEEEVTDTLFFFPITAILHDLANLAAEASTPIR